MEFKQIFSMPITGLKERDTGLALAFLALLIWFFSSQGFFVYLAMGILLAAMVLPKSMYYPAKLWFGLALFLGIFVSKIILGIIYILVLLPVALIRQALGKDSMRLKAYKDGKPSAFVVREHLYSGNDLKNPF